MIFKRLYAKLRAQDWMAISIEIVIVIIGVFIGNQVSNWNEARLERRETREMLAQLQPELQAFHDFFVSARAYYGVVRAYADGAAGGWERRPDISDAQFVIDAYQASQIYGIGASNETWALIFGASELRGIKDVALRRGLSNLMTADFSAVDVEAVSTPYRDLLRSVIPADIQQAIRDHCGDRPVPDKELTVTLPPTCTIEMDGKLAAQTAAALRGKPEIADALRLHLSAIAVFLDSAANLDQQTLALSRRIAASNVAPMRARH